MKTLASELSLPLSPQRSLRGAARQFYRVACGALLSCWFAASVVHADEPRAAGGQEARLERRLLVLRAEDRPHSSLETRVDRVLGTVLSELGFLVNVSPMPFREAQLALGCTGSITKCGTAVAAALESEQLAVSSLEQQPGEDEAYLVLYLFAPGVARDGRTAIPVSGGARQELLVRELARHVFEEGAPERMAKRKPEPEPAPKAAVPPRMERVAPVVVADLEPRPAPFTPAPAFTEDSSGPKRNRTLLALGWSAATLGGALLVSGTATALAARNSSDEYAEREIGSRQDADSALAAYARAERQADASRVLLGTGAAFVVGGAVMLLWERLAPSEDRKLHLAPVPVARGAAVSLSRSFGGRSW